MCPVALPLTSASAFVMTGSPDVEVLILIFIFGSYFLVSFPVESFPLERVPNIYWAAENEKNFFQKKFPVMQKKIFTCPRQPRNPLNARSAGFYLLNTSTMYAVFTNPRIRFERYFCTCAGAKFG